MNQYKQALLRRSFSKGLGPFWQTFFLLLKDKIVGPTFLVYALTESDLSEECIPHYNNFSINSYNNWQQISPSLRQTIQKELHNDFWGEIEWFQRGWTLWIGTLENEPVILSWTRTQSQSTDFYSPIEPTALLIWQTVTFPRHRGKGLFPLILACISKLSFSHKATRIYGSCRDYNVPSSKAMLKVGFRMIGYTKKVRFFSHTKFYPNKAIAAVD